MPHVLDSFSDGHKRVLDALFRDGPSSRAEIAVRTGFTRSAITQIVQDLTDIGLLSESEARKGQRGQPARPVGIKGSAAYAIGVNFSHSYLELVLIDAGCRVLHQATVALDAPTPEAIADTIGAQIDDALARRRVSRNKVLGVGISLPGDFYADGTLMAHHWFPAFRRADLPGFFEDRLGLPVRLENDGRVCAMGERVVGEGTRFRTFMLVHIGHGVGGGLIIDGKPYRGAYGNAGIMGQYYPYTGPRPSGQDLLETLQAAGFTVSDFNQLDALPAAAAPVVDAWVKRAASQLCGDIARVQRFFGPEAIILAGRLPSQIMADLAAAIDLESVLRPLDDLPIPPLMSSKLGSHAGTMGAATLPIYHLFLPS